MPKENDPDDPDHKFPPALEGQNNKTNSLRVSAPIPDKAQVRICQEPKLSRIGQITRRGSKG